MKGLTANLQKMRTMDRDLQKKIKVIDKAPKSDEGVNGDMRMKGDTLYIKNLNRWYKFKGEPVLGRSKFNTNKRNWQKMTATGSTGSNANEIDKDDGSRIFVTGADGTKGIKMPEIDRMEIGDKFEVHNLSGSNLYIWPYDGGDQIWGRIPGAAVTVAGRSMTIIVLANDRLWQAAEVTEP